MKHDCDSAETAASLGEAGSEREPVPACSTDHVHHANAPRETLARGVCVSARGGNAMFEAHPQTEVEALLKSDTEFRQLFRRHQELDKQVLDAELGVLPLDDTTLARMKKEKLFAKDRLTRMFERHSGVH
jgi:uncharacterized protein YdcH (DUF465 family)